MDRRSAVICLKDWDVCMSFYSLWFFRQKVTACFCRSYLLLKDQLLYVRRFGFF